MAATAPTSTDSAVTIRPRLVPPAPEDPPPTASTPTYEGLVSQLGYRSDAGIHAASAGVGLMPMFQPVVSLPEERVIGFEALARWPALQTVTPHNVFSFANASRRADALDQQCIDAAVRIALDAGMPRGSLLLINTEPVATHVPRSRQPALSAACERFQVVFELTERQLLAHPRSLLKKVEAIRADGIAIAVDDVGAHPDSLAVLDVIDPDIVKLDMAMIQNSPERDRATTLTGVLAHHERTGALIIAEGVETDEHLEQALAVGAGLAQGFRFGNALPLSRFQCAEISPTVHPKLDAVRHARTPAAESRKALRVARKEILAAFSQHIENQARHAVDHPMVLAAFQRAEDFVDGPRRLFQDLATMSPLVVVFGRDMPADLGGGVRGVALHKDDPLCEEWAVVTLGADTCRALVARQLAEPLDRSADRRFEFLITADRVMVTKAARDLLARVP